MPTSTRILTTRTIRDLTDADALARWLGLLGYEIDARIEQSPENLGIESEAMRRPIRRIERLARRADEMFAFYPFEIYLFELSKITLAQTRALVKPFRDRAGFFLLILTTDWDRLDFVYVERLAPEADSGTGISRRETPRVRPRILSLKRAQPTRVGMRVLRRLAWTSSDSWAQNEKVLAAFSGGD